MYNDFVNFVRELYKSQDFIPLHEPRFIGNEKKYLNECIDSTFVSSVGEFVDKFEIEIAKYTKSKYAIACVNGTSALHTALVLCGVGNHDEVITQNLTFVATANAISYCGAKPVFLDVDKKTMGLSALCLKNFLENSTELKGGECFNKSTGKRIKACVPMHSFGHVAEIIEIIKLCNQFNIDVIEDAAESLGSTLNGTHTGTFGKFGVLSFNGNKTITSGGGGVILTSDEELAKRAKHITTTAKKPHKWEFNHDEIAFNYRMPNINAALALAQLEQLDVFLIKKRQVAKKYEAFFDELEIEFVQEQKGVSANYWLNTILFKDKLGRDEFLEFTNSNGVMTRPAWELMSNLPMFEDCQVEDIKNSVYLSERLVNIPSSVLV